MKFLALRMNQVAAGAAVVMGLALAGCEWDSSSDGYNSRYNFVNFSGVYRGINGGLLVTDYTSQLSTPDSQGSVGSTNNVESERIATANGSQVEFAGRLDHDNIVRGSLSIIAQNTIYTFVDESPFEGTLTADGGSGFINYDTGDWSLDFNAAPESGIRIVASYKYYIEPENNDSSSGTGSGPRGNATSGASGKSIYAFTVEHYGNQIKITDNNGKVYEGNFGDIRSTSGVNQDNSGGVTVSAGDSFIGNFEAKGTSAAGKSVTMVGTFQGLVESAAGTSGTLSEREMLGTWVEKNGKTGDISGGASPISITIPTGTDTDTDTDTTTTTTE